MFRKTIVCAALLIGATPALAEGVEHKIAIHVDTDDRQVLNMALNNAANAQTYFTENGDTVVLEVVAHGPGLTMLLDSQSPVADRIATMALEFEDMKFSACGNTLKKMNEKQGKDLALLSEAQVVPSGVARLVELQEQGYSYVRP